MKLLHIDSSALSEQSVSRQLGNAIVSRWRDEMPGLQVTHRDLDADPLPHLTAAALAGTDSVASRRAEQVLQEFLDSDIVVIGAPMYNFGIPSTLKAWIDRVAVAGKTFRYTEQGPQGLAGGKKVIIASARGGLHSGSPADFQEPYLKAVLAFLGIEDVEFVRAEGLALSPQHRLEAIDAALAAIPSPLRKAA
ncbi:FMN-dependent NADH-azoreductase [Pseudoxanthomonas kalamensis DSM 18571]|uniref:FMN-dependent NADH-azoreductase n=1 Tax=Pseudoxanthomonas kalamensis TaxID=289483 RepID=UPI00139177B5|nr:NAD(P)H-dependent oxidoreductase [Pseudoxanthomonas kalamensis]KAF1709726.1 FMN-dependent NADH-azoreductase [Pseudoxanthomonas kalamensis DSM 18571]